MPKKRKVALVETTNDNDDSNDNVNVHNITMQHGTMYAIMSNVQMNETFHNKYIKEMQQLYKKMDHGNFMFTFIKMIKSAMEAEESNEYAYTTLLFCAKYISSYQCEETHILVKDIFKWLTSTISTSPHIRYRLCQFVNIVLNALGVEAALDDCICDSIMSYMIHRLRDMSPNVRVQAILALQRLQIPDNPDDIIVKTYQFHLSADPSPKVRQAVITSMGRNYNTIPYILERLWDIDEKVRRHTYLNMSSYPVKAYKVSQRLTFLEQGLNDRSEMVRKVVTSVMLPQWLESYNKNYISLIEALKLDANEAEMDRFRKITKVALKEVFKSANIEEIVKYVPLENNEETEFSKCVPHEILNVEVSIFWLCLIEFLQIEMADELDLIIPDLSTFCAYILKFCESRLNVEEDKWKKMEYQYILLTLIEIAYTYDLGDEIGRENLKQLIDNLLKNYDLEDQTVEVIVKCTENLIVNQEDRLQFFVDIIKDISASSTWKPNDFINDRSLIEELLDKHPDKNLKLKLSSLKVKILDLEEQERNYVEKKDYVTAQKKADERATCNEEYMNLLKPLLIQNSTTSTEAEQRNLSISLQHPKKVTVEDITKSLQIAFYMVVSKKVRSLTPNVCELYKDFIRRHIESNQTVIRNWALKCGTAYSMLYDQLAKDVYNELYSQFFKNQNISIWNTSIDCIFELLDRYGFNKFENADKQTKNKKPGRQLYTLGLLDVQDKDESTSGSDVDVVFMMSHILDTCDHVCIMRAIVTGLCRLVLHGHIKKDDIVEKLLLKYFNPATESEINQILGVFFENLIQKKKQEYLQPCLLPTVITILSAPYDSPLHEIKPETILRFVIDSTRPQFCSTGLNIHNTIALSFMQEMQNNIANKELVKILSKELITLEIAVSDDLPLRNDLKNCCDILLQNELDPKTVTNILNFKSILNGDFQRIVQRPSHEILVEENVEDLSEIEENESNEQSNKNTVQEDTNFENIPEETQNKTAVDISEIDLVNCNRNETIDNCNDITTEPLAISKSNEIESRNDLSKKTPTTFGKDNATNVRHLRKSRNINSLDGPSRPAKRRNDSKSVDNESASSNTVHEAQTNSNLSHIARESTNLSSDIIINDSTPSTPVNNEKLLPISNQHPHYANSSESELNESDVIPATPSPQRNITPIGTSIAKRSQRVAAIQRAKLLSSSGNLTSKRSMNFTRYAKSTEDISESILHKQSQKEKAKQIEDKTNDLNSLISNKNKENLLMKDNRKILKSQTPKNLTVNTENRKKTNPSISSPVSNYRTRNHSRLELQFNSIMTRTRTSIEKNPLNLETTPTRSTTKKTIPRCVVKLRRATPTQTKQKEKSSKIPISKNIRNRNNPSKNGI